MWLISSDVNNFHCFLPAKMASHTAMRRMVHVTWDPLGLNFPLHLQLGRECLVLQQSILPTHPCAMWPSETKWILKYDRHQQLLQSLWTQWSKNKIKRFPRQFVLLFHSAFLNKVLLVERTWGSNTCRLDWFQLSLARYVPFFCGKTNHLGEEGENWSVIGLTSSLKKPQERSYGPIHLSCK